MIWHEDKNIILTIIFSAYSLPISGKTWTANQQNNLKIGAKFWISTTQNLKQNTYLSYKIKFFCISYVLYKKCDKIRLEKNMITYDLSYRNMYVNQSS